MKKKRKIALLCILTLIALIAVAYLLFWPWMRIAEMYSVTCAQCGSNKSITIYFGKFNGPETNRKEVITFHGDDFRTCPHDWKPGVSQTNLTKLNN
jgi:hypothetical protein